jgi:hypothetical protein
LLMLLLLLNVSSAYALGIRVVDILLITILFFFLMFFLFPDMFSGFF